MVYDYFYTFQMPFITGNMETIFIRTWSFIGISLLHQQVHYKICEIIIASIMQWSFTLFVFSINNIINITLLISLGKFLNFFIDFSNFSILNKFKNLKFRLIFTILCKLGEFHCWSQEFIISLLAFIHFLHELILKY